MDDLTPEERRLLLTAVKIAYEAHRKVHVEASATFADRNISRHYRRLANSDVNFAAEQMSKLSRLDGKLRLLLANMKEAA